MLRNSCTQQALLAPTRSSPRHVRPCCRQLRATAAKAAHLDRDRAIVSDAPGFALYPWSWSTPRFLKYPAPKPVPTASETGLDSCRDEGRENPEPRPCPLLFRASGLSRVISDVVELQPGGSWPEVPRLIAGQSRIDESSTVSSRQLNHMALHHPLTSSLNSLTSPGPGKKPGGVCMSWRSCAQKLLHPAGSAGTHTIFSTACSTLLQTAASYSGQSSPPGPGQSNSF